MTLPIQQGPRDPGPSLGMSSARYPTTFTLPPSISAYLFFLSPLRFSPNSGIHSASQQGRARPPRAVASHCSSPFVFFGNLMRRHGAVRLLPCHDQPPPANREIKERMELSCITLCHSPMRKRGLLHARGVVGRVGLRSFAQPMWSNATLVQCLELFADVDHLESERAQLR